MKRTRKVAPKGPQPVKLTTVTTEINGANRTLIVGREVSLHHREGLKGNTRRYRLTGIERETSGRLLLTVFGPLSVVKPKQRFVRPEDIKAQHHKPKKVRTTPCVKVAEAPVCDNCLSSKCPGASRGECQERD